MKKNDVKKKMGAKTRWGIPAEHVPSTGTNRQRYLSGAFKHKYGSGSREEMGTKYKKHEKEFGKQVSKWDSLPAKDRPWHKDKA